MQSSSKRSPGHVRDAIIRVLETAGRPLDLASIEAGVRQQLGDTPSSSIRSYLRLNTPHLFSRDRRGVYRVSRPAQLQLAPPTSRQKPFACQKAVLHHDDCLAWLEGAPPNSVHAIVTDPPYGLHEYTQEQQRKLQAGKGGVWRLPPSFDGHKRSPVPRFTTLDERQLDALHEFFTLWGRLALRVLTPGANLIVASNPLVSHIASTALADAGLERRGEIVRLTMTLRGGDRPKGAHDEFQGVSVMPRSMWEPWLAFRKPLDGRVQDNLRKWRTGGFRRPDDEKPFGDVIPSAPTRRTERLMAPHPGLKPQAFLRRLVRGALPLGEGVVLDTFAGAGSTLAACNAVGYRSIGVESAENYFKMAVGAISKLTAYDPGGS